MGRKGHDFIPSLLLSQPLKLSTGRTGDVITIAVSGSRDMIEAIKKEGGNPSYTEYPEEAHNLWEKITNNPELLDWLLAQERK